MRIAVIGAGALGTLLGGLLAVAGEDVHLLHHRERYVDAVNDEGVRIERDGRSRTVTIPATTDAADVGPVDLGLVLVRSYQTREALAEHAACIGPETRLLTLQNGLGNDEMLRSVVGEERTLSGLTYQGADLASPGVVRHTNVGETVLGPAGEFAERVRDRFEAAGVEVRVVEDPRPYVWDKQFVSIAFKPLAALTRLTNGPMVRDEALRELVGHLVGEARAVAEARGVELLTEDPVGKVREIGEANPDHRSSMLQDVAAGRKTEIDEVNGAVVAYGHEAGVPVPYNAAMTALVRGLERSYLD
jgi:2-dehydropantoate 2-reductase